MTDFEFINNTFVSMLKITKIGNEGKRLFVRWSVPLYFSYSLKVHTRLMNFNFPQGHPTLIVVLKESVFILLSKSLHFYIILLIFNKLINFYRFEANSSREFRTFWYSKKKNRLNDHISGGVSLSKYHKVDLRELLILEYCDIPCSKLTCTGRL